MNYILDKKADYEMNMKEYELSIAKKQVFECYTIRWLDSWKRKKRRMKIHWRFWILLIQTLQILPIHTYFVKLEWFTPVDL